jgi:hypothetical protein
MCTLSFVCLAGIDARVSAALFGGAAAFVAWELIQKLTTKRRLPGRQRERQRRDAWGYE